MAEPQNDGVKNIVVGGYEVVDDVALDGIDVKVDAGALKGADFVRGANLMSVSTPQRPTTRSTCRCAFRCRWRGMPDFTVTQIDGQVLCRRFTSLTVTSLSRTWPRRRSGVASLTPLNLQLSTFNFGHAPFC